MVLIVSFRFSPSYRTERLLPYTRTHAPRVHFLLFPNSNVVIFVFAFQFNRPGFLVAAIPQTVSVLVSSGTFWVPEGT